MARGSHATTARRPRILIALSVVGLVIALVSLTGFVLVETHPAQPATIRPLLAESRVVPGVRPTITWPSSGEGAVGIADLDVAEHSAVQTIEPVGSVAKLMTALVVLADHPLAPGSSGPTITITPDEEQIWAGDVGSDQSNVEVVAGEQLTERQLLEGLLVHSANNLASTLAIYDAGSVPAFVAKMNAMAHSFGLTDTTYADASGFSPNTVSTAADQLVVATHAMANPVIAGIVKMTSVWLPVAGRLKSYTPFDGFDGVVGVKSGLTTQAGGCDVLALDHEVAGRTVQVIAVVTGQLAGNRLVTAGLDALWLARQAANAIVALPVATPTIPVALAGWEKGTTGALYASTPIVTPAWPARTISLSLDPHNQIYDPIVPFEPVGALVVTSGSIAKATPLEAHRGISPPSTLRRVV